MRDAREEYIIASYGWAKYKSIKFYCRHLQELWSLYEAKTSFFVRKDVFHKIIQVANDHSY